MPTNLNYTIKELSSPKYAKIIMMQGEIDESNEEVLHKLFEKLMADQGLKYVIFDLGELTYINSRVIGIFLLWHKNFNDEGKQYAFANVHEATDDIMKVVGLSTAIDTYDTVEEAKIAMVK